MYFIDLFLLYLEFTVLSYCINIKQIFSFLEPMLLSNNALLVLQWFDTVEDVIRIR
jgi:hypothetical protein